MIRVFSQLKKNWSLLFRSKFSLFVLIMGPILSILLLSAFFYNANTYYLDVGIHDASSNQLSERYAEALSKSQFEVSHFESNSSCIESLQRGMVHVCFFIPKTQNLSEESLPDISIVIDTSRSVVSSVVTNLLLEVLEKESREIQSQYANEIFTTLASNEEALEWQNKALTNISWNLELMELNNKRARAALLKVKGFDANDFEIETLKKRTSSLNNSIQSFATSSESLLNESSDALENMTTTLANTSTNPSGNKEILESKIDDIEDAEEEILVRIGALKTNFNMESILNLADSLEEELEKTATTLEESEEGLDGSLHENFETLNALQGDVKAINDSTAFLRSSLLGISVENTQNFVNPIEVKIEDALGEKTGQLIAMFPELFMAFVMILGIILGVSFTVLEKGNPAFERNILSRVPSAYTIISSLLSLSSLLLIQLFVLLLVCFGLFFKLSFSDILLILVLLLPAILSFILLGILIASLSPNQSSAMGASFFVIVFLFIISGQLLPLELIPDAISSYLYYNPLQVAQAMLRKLFLFSLPLSELYLEIVILSLYFIVFFILSTLADSYLKRQSLYHLFHRYHKKKEERK